MTCRFVGPGVWCAVLKPPVPNSSEFSDKERCFVFFFRAADWSGRKWAGLCAGEILVAIVERLMPDQRATNS
jgi:hypothetical protein